MQRRSRNSSRRSPIKINGSLHRINGLIAIEKNGAVSGEQGKQNAKEILRVERQTTDQFKQLVNLMNEGFARVEERIIRVEERINRVETNLKNDIIRMEERTQPRGRADDQMADLDRWGRGYHYRRVDIPQGVSAVGRHSPLSHTNNTAPSEVAQAVPDGAAN